MQSQSSSSFRSSRGLHWDVKWVNQEWADSFINISCQLQNCNQTILKRDRTYRIVKHIKRIASNVINCYCFFQLQLLHIKWLRLAYVVWIIFHTRCNHELLSQFHLIDHKDCNKDHIIIFWCSLEYYLKSKRLI